MPYDLKSEFLVEVEKLYATGEATEHSYRPVLRNLLTSHANGGTVTNEPKRIDCGAPDFVIRSNGLVVGYVEAKDPTVPLAIVQDNEQVGRYRKNLENLLLTNTHEFQWYVRGELRATAKLATFNKKTGVLKPSDVDGTATLLTQFLCRDPLPIKSAEVLAVRLAGLADAIRSAIITAYEEEVVSDLLEGWRAAIAKVLISDLGEPSQTPRFADMIAQTLTYGLFTARVMNPTSQTFSRQEAQSLIPKSNPFLRQFFFQLSSPDIEDEPYAAFVDDIVTVLANADFAAILKNFGRTTKSQDPVVHFYETFLAAYDPKLRELRGVYYTPQPVVSYLVRSVDKLLISKFKCAAGLADSSMIPVKASAKKKKDGSIHKVMVLDPACGTGAFLYEVVAQIRDRFRKSNNAGLWPEYVRDHLLPRLYGFEVLMAPYAIAHFKLSLELLALDLPEAERAAWSFSGATNERLGVYLTNTLEPPHEYHGLPLFTQWLSAETNSANSIKTDAPIMVLLGNPPYNNFGRQNANEYISGLLADYKQGLADRKLNLDDDYIKFIRFAQERIERTGYGIVAFVTNSSFTSGLVHRRMRESLRETFSDIYVLNMHGNAVTGETPPKGKRDANVFDIKQGVAATIFVKAPGGKVPGRVWYSDLWGTRQEKYDSLDKIDVENIKWQELKNIDSESCLGKFFFFKPTSNTGIEKYCEGKSLDEIFVSKLSGIQTKRDALFVDTNEQNLSRRMKEVLKHGPTAEMVEKYPLEDSTGWSGSRLSGVKFNEESVEKYAYRPYDWRYIYYEEAALGRPRKDISRHLRQDNLALAFLRQTVDDEFRHVLVSSGLTDINYLMSHHVSDRVAPLYLYETLANKVEKRPNIRPSVQKELSEQLGMKMLPFGCGDRKVAWGPEDLFSYIYAVLWSPKYRKTYDEFLKIGFPRIPLNVSRSTFFQLADRGKRLIDLHLLKNDKDVLPSFPVAGTNQITRAWYSPEGSRLFINDHQYLDNVSEHVWHHKIGCYTVVQRWLSERRGKFLSSDEREHLRKMVAAINSVDGVLAEIDSILVA